MDFALVQIGLTILAFLGVIISFVGLPGVFLVLLAAILLGLITDFSAISVNALIILGVISVLSTFVDNIAMILGANKFGGSKWGMAGAIIFAIIGLFILGPLGVILGALVGAFVAEFVIYKNVNKASLVSIGTFIGFLAGTIIKLIITISAFVWLMFVLW